MNEWVLCKNNFSKGSGYNVEHCRVRVRKRVISFTTFLATKHAMHSLNRGERGLADHEMMANSGNVTHTLQCVKSIPKAKMTKHQDDQTINRTMTMTMNVSIWNVDFQCAHGVT